MNPDIMRPAIEPSRRFQPLEWLLWNEALGEVIPKVMRDIKLTA